MGGLRSVSRLSVRALFVLRTTMAEVVAADVPQNEKDELFCAYAGMILTDSGLNITEDNLNTLIKKAGGTIDSFYPRLFAKVCQGKEISEMLKFGGGGGAGPAVGGGGGAADAGAGEAKKEEKKVVEEEEEEEEVDFDLF